MVTALICFDVAIVCSIHIGTLYLTLMPTELLFRYIHALSDYSRHQPDIVTDVDALYLVYLHLMLTAILFDVYPRFV